MQVSHKIYGPLSFDSAFQCDPTAPRYGFKSWDDFFTRRFRSGIRPIADFSNDNVIVNPCEASPYRIYRDVKWVDQFWIKGQPYSLSHMLAQDPLARHFVGGTIYQAFLSATSYHRWHSPVSGRIVKAYISPGTYYATAPMEGFKSDDDNCTSSNKDPRSKSARRGACPEKCFFTPDSAAPNSSQSYITAVATRGVIFIQADNPLIGLMCFLPVGMAEVSTCDITVSHGQHVLKGDELGTFHYGGSTMCMIFRKEVDLTFDLHGEEERIGLGANNIDVNSRIATVTAPKYVRD
jgi:phosphatidylserine decarboxylase